MAFSLGDFFPEEVFQNVEITFLRGDYWIVKVKPFYKKTSILLVSNIKEASDEKLRPFIVEDKKNEKVIVFFLTTNEKYQKIRPKIRVSKCNFFKTSIDCGIDLNLEFSWVFKNPGRHSYFYSINIHILNELYKEKKLKKCGHCSEQVVEEFLDNIESFSRGRR